MKTPITDAVRSADHLIDTARRLELDRAALMEALADMVSDHEQLSCATLQFARAALAAARANFPTP